LTPYVSPEVALSLQSLAQDEEVRRMTKRKLLPWTLGICAFAVACFYTARHWTIEIKVHAQVRATPFVLDTDYYNFEKQPQGELMERRVTARRSDGSTAVVYWLHWGRPYWRTSEIPFRTLTFLNGTGINVLDLITSRTMVKRDAGLAVLKERLVNPPPNCMYRFAGQENLLGNDTVAGQRVGVVEYLQQSPLHDNVLTETRTTMWLAPGLGCEQLQYRYQTKQADGSYKLMTEARLAFLKIGEPETSYFDPAPNYTEMKPSEVLK